MDGGGEVWVWGNPWEGFDTLDIWAYNDVADIFDLSDLSPTEFDTSEFKTISTANPNEIVADGVDFLRVISEVITKGLKAAPGVPQSEVRRFEALTDTLEGIRDGILVGNLTQQQGKAFVRSAFELALGGASDVALSLAAGILVNQAAQYLPGYGKLLPVVAVVGTYIATLAVNDLTDLAAYGITEAVFAFYEGVKNFGDWMGMTVPYEDLNIHDLGGAIFDSNAYGAGQGEWRPTTWTAGTWETNILAATP